MKPTELQKKICDLIISQAEFWKVTNDINSPTHYCDIGEEILRDFDELSDSQKDILEDRLIDLLIFVRSFKNEQERRNTP